MYYKREMESKIKKYLETPEIIVMGLVKP